MLVGILGIISFLLFASSIRTTKDGGLDGRCKVKWGLTILSLIIFVIAILLA